jgi:hypothetical protein
VSSCAGQLGSRQSDSLPVWGRKRLLAPSSLGSCCATPSTSTGGSGPLLMKLSSLGCPRRLSTLSRLAVAAQLPNGA